MRIVKARFLIVGEGVTSTERRVGRMHSAVLDWNLKRYPYKPINIYIHTERNTDLYVLLNMYAHMYVRVCIYMDVYVS